MAAMQRLGGPIRTTAFHAKFWAERLRLAYPHDGVEAFSRSIGNARVDLNPYQVDAALFALRSSYSKGVLLADEVGLGKTIEAFTLPAHPARRHRRQHDPRRAGRQFTFVAPEEGK